MFLGFVYVIVSGMYVVRYVMLNVGNSVNVIGCLCVILVCVSVYLLVNVSVVYVNVVMIECVRLLVVMCVCVWLLCVMLSMF